MAGTWSDLNNQPGVNLDTMLLLTDGRVLCHEFQSKNWHTPDAARLRRLPRRPLGLGRSLARQHEHPNGVRRPDERTDLLRVRGTADGRVFVAGGEYNLAQQTANDSLTAQIYDPRSNYWAAISTPPGWTGVGDAVSCVLPDGRLMLGQYNGTAVAIYDPDLDLWSFTSAKGDSCSEETFTLMPDNTVVTVQCSNANNAEKYLIASDQWVSAGTTPSTLPQACAGQVAEIGAASRPWTQAMGLINWRGASRGLPAYQLEKLAPCSPGR